MPVNMHSGSAGPQLPQVPSGSGDGGLPNLSEQELLMLQQTSQTHDAISFWLDWVSQCLYTRGSVPPVALPCLSLRPARAHHQTLRALDELQQPRMQLKITSNRSSSERLLAS